MIAKRAIGTLATGAILAATVGACGGDDADYTLRLRVANAAGLLKNQDVKIDGVRAGKVSDVRLGEGDQAEITMKLQRGASPVGTDAVARIRAVSVLGEKYVDLEPRTVKRPAPSGSWVTPSKIVTPVELDDVLNTLDAGTRSRLKLILAEGGVALTGRADEVRDLLAVLPRGMHEVGELLDQATDDNASLRQVIDSGDRVITTLAKERRQLGRLIAEATGAFSATADRRIALGRAVGQAPQTLAQMRTTLGKLERTAISVRPAADRIRTSAQPIDDSLKALPAFTGSAVPTLRAARAAAPDLTRLARGTEPAVRRLGPVAAQLADVVQAADPIVQGLDKGLMNDALYFLQTWARVTQRADGLGHLFGAQITITEDTVRQIIDRVLSEGAGNTKKRDRPSAPVRPAKPQTGPVRKAPLKDTLKPLAPVEKLVCETLDGVTKAVDDVVGGLLGGRGGAGSAKRPSCPQAPAAPAPSAEDRGQPRSSNVEALVDYLFGS